MRKQNKHMKIERKTLALGISVTALLVLSILLAGKLWNLKANAVENSVSDLSYLLNSGEKTNLGYAFKCVGADEYKNVEKINIELNCASLTLCESSDDNITMYSSGRFGAQKYACDISENTLDISARVKVTADNLCVALPKELITNRAVAIDIKTIDTLVLADDFGLDLSRSTLAISSRGGDVAVCDINAQVLTLSVEGGDVLIEDCCAVVLRAVTTSGDLAVGGAYDEVVLESLSGNVTGEFDTLFNRADITASSGDIGLIIPERSGLCLNLRAYRGSVDLPFEGEGEIDAANQIVVYRVGDGIVPLNINGGTGKLSVSDSAVPNAIKQRVIEMLLQIYGADNMGEKLNQTVVAED